MVEQYIFLPLDKRLGKYKEEVFEVLVLLDSTPVLIVIVTCSFLQLIPFFRGKLILCVIQKIDVRLLARFY